MAGFEVDRAIKVWHFRPFNPREWLELDVSLMIQKHLLSKGMDKSDAGLVKRFQEVDADGSGNISADEMRAAVRRMYGKALPEMTLQKMMRAADTDGDGEVSLDEFKVIMRSGPEDDMVKAWTVTGAVDLYGLGTVSDNFWRNAITGGMERVKPSAGALSNQ